MLSHDHSELKDFSYIVFLDSSRRYVDCSEGVLHLLGYGRSEFLNKSVDDISYWLDDVPVLFKDFIRRGKQKGTYILRHMNGSPIPVQYDAFVFPDGCKAAVLLPIKEWRVAYLDVISETDSAKLGHRIDVALAAIYGRLYANDPEPSLSDGERAAINEAMSSLGALKQKAATALNAELLEFEITRSALLQLASARQDRDATRVLLEENRPLIESSIHRFFDSSDAAEVLPALLDRIALKARYYDPDANPLVWLQECLQLECKWLRMEMDRAGNGETN
jgi:PAS domain